MAPQAGQQTSARDSILLLICKNFVELRGFEPLTPSMPWRCATSCATAPHARRWRVLGEAEPAPQRHSLAPASHRLGNDLMAVTPAPPVPRPIGVDATFMQVEVHERGIHIVRSGGGRVSGATTAFRSAGASGEPGVPAARVERALPARHASPPTCGAGAQGANVSRVGPGSRG